MNVVYGYAFKPSKNYSKMMAHLRPTPGIVCYTRDRNDYTEERNSMATIQPYFIPISKAGNLQWYKARRVDNMNITVTLADAIPKYNAEIRMHMKALQVSLGKLSRMVI